jgi:5-methylthioadenosine/S-adenosylhomocysteine deaminase
MPDNTLSSRYIISGRIVTMDSQRRVVSGSVLVNGNRLEAVVPDGQPMPAGFQNAIQLQTKGTIYPGLIELHNHLSYNILPLLPIAKQCTNRDQWSTGINYTRQVTGPMKVLSQTAGFLPAIVRWVECKCLLGGVTTTQGIALSSNQGITRYYRGLIRNVEQPAVSDLPRAASHIADVDAKDATKFLAELKSRNCLLLHLSEGTDSKAHEHFAALRMSNGKWAIAPSLSGIHCVALTAADFRILQENGGSMVWSPLSNLLLYGKTADIKVAKAAKLVIGIGSDWAPSGSKNLLGELKVARIVSRIEGNVFSDQEIVEMATVNGAAILKWSAQLGSIEAGKLADLVVVEGTNGDPYSHLVNALESDIRLVVIDGVPRSGAPSLLSNLFPTLETWKVGSKRIALNLAQQDADPAVGKVTLKAAGQKLQSGLHDLKALAKALEQPTPHLLRAESRTEWKLVLDHEEPEGVAQRPHLRDSSGHLTGMVPRLAAALAAKPLSELLTSLELEPLTMADQPSFVDQLQQQPNLSAAIKRELAKLVPSAVSPRHVARVAAGR